MSQLEAGRKLGRYELVKEIGKGAMGVVYLGKDPIIGRMVALKTLRSTYTDDEDEAKEFRERFVREAQTAGILSHPNIVTIHDIGEDKDANVSYIAMEYIEGKNLKQLLLSGKQFSSGEAARIVSQIAEALEYAHSRKIIHRDVKPANIIITGGGKVKIMDFGIAKIASSNLTTTGQFLGTPNYMSPEQVTGDPLDHRTDLFSLGVVLYELLTRRKPFVGENLTTISYKIVNEPIASPHEVQVEVPAEFDYIVAKAMAKDPARRYQSAEEMAHDLRRLATESGWWEAEWGTIVSTMPEEFVRPASAGGTDVAAAELAGTEPRPSRLRFGRLLAILAPALLLLGIGYGFVYRDAGKSPTSVISAAQHRDVEAQKALLELGKEQVAKGDFDAAIATFKKLETLDPGNPQAAKYVAEVEARRIQLMTENEREAEVKRQLDEGKAFYEGKLYEQAVAAFQSVLVLDAENLEAREFATMSQERLDLERAKQSAASPRPPRGQLVRPALVSPVPSVAEKATLVLELNSQISEGTMTVRIDNRDLYNKAFKFENKKNIFGKKKEGGVMTDSMEIPAGVHKVQVSVTAPDKEIEATQSLQVDLAAGSRHTLRIDVLAASRSIEVKLL